MESARHAFDRFAALNTVPAERLAEPERKRRSVQEAKSPK
jgi:hypothetical protein